MSHVAANKNTDNYICKLIFIAIALFFFTARLAAQNKAAESAEEIRLAIRESSMDTNRISLQLKLGDYYMRHPGEVKNNMDSAINLFNQATVLSIKLHELDWQYNALAMLGTYYAYNGETERSRAIFRRLISYFHQKGNMQKEADAWNWMGDLYNGKKDNQQERLGFYQQARSLYLQSHHLSQAAQTLSGIASIHIETKQYKLAGNELQEVLAEYKASGNKDLQGTYLQLFSFEYARGNYYRAMAYCLEEIENEKASQITPGSAYFYAGAAMCNDAVKKHEEAVKWSRKAMTIERHPVIFLYISKYILIKNLIDLNRIKEARIALNDFSSGKPLRLLDTFYQYRMTALYLDKINKSGLAVRCYVKILELEYKRDIEKEVYEFWSVMCNNETAGIYLKTKLAPKAKKYIDSAAFTFKNAKTALDPEFLVAFYDNSYKYNLATGNYRAAITNLQRRVKLQDSLFTADKDKQLAELNIQYQTAQQELSIKDLHSQGTAQQVRLEKANLQRNITIGGIVVMILVSALFYRNYKQKRSANKIITHKNELLQHLLTEKEWLLKEVHHRVKNNLHTVICLLESQARYLENDALKAIENSQHRIYAMSLIHQKLYQSDDIKTIDMSEYIPELVQSLQDGFDTSGQIQFKLKIAPVSLDISYAIPLGLIINEAVTNSIKYAFPANRKGVISISMVDEGEQVRLEVTDNGIGMPQTDHEGTPESLGLRLMKGLSEDIDADISFTVDNGTRIIIVFEAEGRLLGSAGTKETAYV